MNIRKALLEVGVLTVAVAVAAGALWVGEAPAQTATTTTSVQRAWNSSLVSVRGIVSGSPESVSFSGSAKVGTRLAPDPDFGSPSLILSIDLSGVSGVGSSSGAKYVISGPEIVQKRHAAVQDIEITFPFVKSGMTGMSARSGVASFGLTVDLTTGAVTSASGSISTPRL
jgi:hypothetical protein